MPFLLEVVCSLAGRRRIGYTGRPFLVPRSFLRSRRVGYLRTKARLPCNTNVFGGLGSSEQTAFTTEPCGCWNTVDCRRGFEIAPCKLSVEDRTSLASKQSHCWRRPCRFPLELGFHIERFA
eukprot:6455649-Amphidinium_carterae.2